MPKNTQRYFCGIRWNVLTGMCRRKKKKFDTFCTLPGRNDQMIIGAKLLDIIYESYGFSGDQRHYI